MTTGGDAECQGDNDNGQLGNGTDGSKASTTAVATKRITGIAAIAAGSKHTCALTANGGVKCWGSNRYGGLGNEKTEDAFSPIDVKLSGEVAAIVTGSFHTCVLTRSDVVQCWGLNENGQLGDGTTENRFTPVTIVEAP